MENDLAEYLLWWLWRCTLSDDRMQLRGRDRMCRHLLRANCSDCVIDPEQNESRSYEYNSSIVIDREIETGANLMYKQILVPIDLAHKSLARTALNRASAMKSADGQVHALTVMSDIPTHVAAQIPKDILEETRASERQELEELVNASGCGANVELRTGPISRTILNKARDVDSDLIIIGSHDPSLQDYLIGSTAASVVRNAACSVLVIRKPD